MEEEKKEKGLDVSTVWFMIVVALFFDVLQWLLAFIVMDWLVTPVFYLTFWFWFQIKGLSFFSTKRAKLLGVGALIEMIPWIDALPTFTFMIARITLQLKIKDAVPGANIIKSDIIKRK